MNTTSLNGSTVALLGNMPAVGDIAPGFTLVDKDLQDRSLEEFIGRTLILNVFPSLDTPVCALSVRRFNSEAASRPDVSVLCISADLPFAHERFCETQGIENVVSLSVFRCGDFGGDYGLLMHDGPLRGLLARAVFVIDAEGRISYRQLVPEISREPDYEAVLDFIDRK